MYSFDEGDEVVASGQTTVRPASPARSAASAAAVVLALVIGCADGGAEVKRVTLTGNYLTGATGQGWNLESGRIARDAADADFELTMTMVISLFPSQPQVGFCRQVPAGGVGGFKRVEDVPSDLGGCPSWSAAQLGGTSPYIADSIAGQGFVVRDRNAIPMAKVMTVSGSNIQADVRVTFDMVKL
jgi:hypothetical protein